MAVNNPLDQLLLELGIDLTPIKDSAGKLRQMLQELNTLSDQAQSKTKQNTAVQTSELTKMQIAAKAAVAAASAAIAEETKKSAVLRTQTIEYQKQIAEQKLLTGAAQAQINQERIKHAALQSQTSQLQSQIAMRRAETEEIKRQMAALNLRNAQARMGGGVAQGGGVGGALTQGIFGSVFGGVIAGQGVVGLVESGIHMAERFIDKIKETVVESGNLVKVRDQFEKLARGANLDPKKYLNDLRAATEGEVPQMQLMNLANAGLKSRMLSPEKVTELTGAMAKLAEASGKEATDGVRALSAALLTGRTRSIAMAAGLTTAELKMKDLPPTMTEVQRGAAQMEQIFDKVTKKAKALGESPDTFADAMDRMKTSMKDAYLSFGEGVNASPGMQMLIELLTGKAKGINEGENKYRDIGTKIGNAFAVSVPVMMQFWDILKQIVKVAGTAADAVFTLFTGASSGADSAARSIGNVGKMIVVVGSVFQLIVNSVDYLLVGVKQLILLMQAGAHYTAFRPLEGKKAFDEASRIGAAANSSWENIFDSMAKQIGDIESSILKAEAGKINKPEKLPSMSSGGGGEGSTRSAQLKTFELLNKRKLELASLELQEEKDKNAKLKTETDRAYREGEKELEEHLKEQRRLSAADLTAQLTELETQFSVQRATIKEQLRLGNTVDTDAAIELETIELTFKKRGQLLESAHQQELTRIEQQGQSERLALRRSVIQNTLVSEQSRIQTEQAQLQKTFAGGEMAPDAYFARQIELVRSLAAAQIFAAQQTLEAGVKNDRTRAEAAEKINRALADGERALTDITMTETDKRLSYIQKKFSPQQAALETQIQYQQQPGVRATVPTEDLLTELLANLAKQRTALMGALATAEPYSDQWYQIYQLIEKTYQSQVKYNSELEKMMDIMRPISQAFDALGRSIENIFGSSFAQNLGAVVSQAGRGLADATRLGDVLAGRGGIQKDPALIQLESEARTLFAGAKTSANELTGPFTQLATAVRQAEEYLNRLAGGPASGTGSVTDDGGIPGGFPRGSGVNIPRSAAPGVPAKNSTGAVIQQWTDKLLAGVHALDNFIGGILNAKSAITGGVGGGIAGAGLGQTVSTAFKLAGPWGMLAGAGAGAVIGMVTGGKQARVKKSIDQLNTSFKGIMDQFSQNTNNLNNTIQQLQLLAAQARQMQSNSKKGSSQFQQAIDQYNQQIQQLTNQQDQTLRKMREQIAILSAPLGAQGAIGEIQQIANAFLQYAGAAKSVQDLADANLFLKESIAQYGNSLSQTLAQDNEQAIQDALQLNDLLYERQRMMIEYSNQVQGVLSQGSLTRQFTRAQTAGQKIYTITEEYKRQKDRIDQQIAAASYRVEAESTIFGLASTRIGLEAQLLVLQNNQTNLDIARIQALASLVAQLSSGDFSSGALGRLLGVQQGVATVGGGTNILQALMGLGGGADILTQLVSAAYEDRAGSGFGAFRAQTL